MKRKPVMYLGATSRGRLRRCGRIASSACRRWTNRIGICRRRAASAAGWRRLETECRNPDIAVAVNGDAAG